MTTKTSNLITVDQAARKFKISVWTIHSWIRRGNISHYGKQPSNVSRPQVLVDAEEIEKRLGLTDLETTT